LAEKEKARVRFVDDGIPCLTQRVLAPYGGWHLLVGCLLLNLTDRCQARPALEKLFELLPGPERGAALMDSDGEARAILRPCGLVNKRIVAIREMSQDYLDPRKRKPLDLRYCGQYAIDSWDIFIGGARLLPEDTSDGELGLYLELMWETQWKKDAKE